MYGFSSIHRVEPVALTQRGMGCSRAYPRRHPARIVDASSSPMAFTSRSLSSSLGGGFVVGSSALVGYLSHLQPILSLLLAEIVEQQPSTRQIRYWLPRVFFVSNPLDFKESLDSAGSRHARDLIVKYRFHLELVRPQLGFPAILWEQFLIKIQRSASFSDSTNRVVGRLSRSSTAFSRDT